MAFIFVSYRRTDAPGHAGRLYDRLVDSFGEANVFKDVDSMEPGADYVEIIEETMAKCDALIAVIGPQWLDAELSGRRRLNDPKDWVRVEIVNALDRKVRVIPVLVHGASMPSAADLPVELKAFARRHAVQLDDVAWISQVRQLIDSLKTDPRPAEALRWDDAPKTTKPAKPHQATPKSKQPTSRPLGRVAEEKTEDAKTLIETAVKRFLEEVPALEPLKLIFAVELRGRGDVQMFRVELPDLTVTEGIAEDARVRVEMSRAFFNVMAKEAHIADWREAFTYGQAKATGVDQILKLIVHVVEKQEERQGTRRARRWGWPSGR